MGVNVRERPEGSGVWWVFINHHGKRKAKKIGNDEEKAREVAEKIKAKLVLGEFNIRTSQPSAHTFKEHAELWLSLPHNGKRKQSTIENYKDNLKSHVYPVLGTRRLDQIKRKDLKGFFDDLLIKGLSRSTVMAIRAPMSLIFVHAVDSEMIETNPLNDLKIEKEEKTFKGEVLTEEESILLLDQFKEYLKGYYYPHTLCFLRTGMRIGELQALQWGDIDFQSRFIEVKRSWRKKRMTETKNRKRRRVDVSPHLADTLKDLRLIQKKKALKNGRPIPEWVFANEKDDIFCRQIFTNVLQKCLELAGLRRIRVHDLRHTYATIRLLRGHNVGDVSYQLGHSSIKITYDTYGHWIPGKFKSEVDELDNPQLSATDVQPKGKGLKIV
jgi:integrase